MAKKPRDRTMKSVAIFIFMILLSVTILVASSYGLTRQSAFAGSEVSDFSYIFKATNLNSKDATATYSTALTSGDLSLSVIKPEESCFDNVNSCSINLDFNGKQFSIKKGETLKLDDFISINFAEVSFNRRSSTSTCPNDNYKYSESGVKQGCAVEEVISPGELTDYSLSFLVSINVEDFIDVEYPLKQNVVKWNSQFEDKALAINKYTKRLSGELNIDSESFSLYRGVDDKRKAVDMPIGKSGTISIDIDTSNIETVKTQINPVIIFKYDTFKLEAISLKTNTKLVDVRPQVSGKEFETFDQKIADRTALESETILPSQVVKQYDNPQIEKQNTSNSLSTGLIIIIIIASILIVVAVIYFLITHLKSRR